MFSPRETLKVLVVLTSAITDLWLPTRARSWLETGTLLESRYANVRAGRRG